MAPNFRRERAGFTLVELLVVIAIIAFLAALIIAFFPSINAQTSEANGAANLQGWLNIARQKAIRNQNPYGLRLWVNVDPLVPRTLAMLQVIECQFIEQPDYFTGGSIVTQSSQNNGIWDTVAWDTSVNPAADPTGGFPDPTLFPVQPGDYFEILGTGLMHRIVNVNTFTIKPPPTAANPNPPPIPAASLSLATPTPFQIGTVNNNTNPPTVIGGTPNYRILRQPRVIGSETLPLPVGVVVDVNTNVMFNNPLPVIFIPANPQTNPPTFTGAYFDVVFSPSGSVITPGVTTTTVNLWVRQVDTNNPTNVFSGNPTVIAVFAQTGFVGAFPPVASNPNPYVDIR